MVPQAVPYRPGEFYRPELPPLRAVLEDLSGLGLLVVDGYADLDPDGRPGLGAHVHAELGIPVIGVAKSRFRTATHAVPVLRGSSVRLLFVTAAGMPAADAADLGPSHDRPVPAARRAAPRRRPCAGTPARSYHDRPPARLTYADARNAADEHVLTVQRRCIFMQADLPSTRIEPRASRAAERRESALLSAHVAVLYRSDPSA